MKSKVKTLGLIAIIAVILFTMTACGGNGKTVPAKLTAYDNQDAAPSLSVFNARSVMNIMPMSAETDPGMETFYE